MNSKKKLAIIGAGDLGQQIAYIASLNNFEISGFYDDFALAGSTNKLLGKIDKVKEDFDNGVFEYLIIGIGYKHLNFKAELYTRFSDHIPFANVIHPSAFIEKNVKLGTGNVIYPSVSLDQGVEIMNNSVLNIGCCIAHDTTIHNHCFISPRASLAGFITILEKNIIGINSTIIDNISIVENCQIGGGTVVIENINKPGLYVGNPARFIRETIYDRKN